MEEYKTFTRKHKIKSLVLELGEEFLDTTSNTPFTSS
jgi:hypothetical protein